VLTLLYLLLGLKQFRRLVIHLDNFGLYDVDFLAQRADLISHLNVKLSSSSCHLLLQIHKLAIQFLQGLKQLDNLEVL